MRTASEETCTVCSQRCRIRYCKEDVTLTFARQTVDRFVTKFGKIGKPGLLAHSHTNYSVRNAHQTATAYLRAGPTACRERPVHST